MSSQFFPLVPAASLATLCTRALFSVWLQATLASKGRPWTWLTKTPTIVSINSNYGNYSNLWPKPPIWWQLYQQRILMDPCRMNPGRSDAGIKTAASCQWLPGFSSSPAVLCGPAFCGALTGEPKVRPPLTTAAAISSATDEPDCNGGQTYDLLELATSCNYRNYLEVGHFNHFLIPII